MAGVNFMEAFRGVHGGFGRKSWERAADAGYNPSQIKTALQQQGAAGASIGAGLRSDYMRHHKGIAHGMSRYQGYHGNIGLAAYARAKMDGYTPDQIREGAQSQGMFLAQKANQQYGMDMQNIQERDQMQAMMDMYQQALDQAQNASSNVSQSVDYSVGTGGNATMKANQSGPKKGKGTKKQWGRKTGGDNYFASALNTGSGSAPKVAKAVGGAASSLNIAPS